MTRVSDLSSGADSSDGGLDPVALNPGLGPAGAFVPPGVASSAAEERVRSVVVDHLLPLLPEQDRTDEVLIDHMCGWVRELGAISYSEELFEPARLNALIDKALASDRPKVVTHLMGWLLGHGTSTDNAGRLALYFNQLAAVRLANVAEAVVAGEGLQGLRIEEALQRGQVAGWLAEVLEQAGYAAGTQRWQTALVRAAL